MDDALADFFTEVKDIEEKQDGSTEKTVEEIKAEVDALKAKGNEFFKKGSNKEAVEQYSKAIELDKTNHVLYSNRSAAYLCYNKLQEALDDAEECIRLAPTWGKAYGRKGAVLFAKKRYEDALESYEEGFMLDKGNPTLCSGRDACKEMLEKSETKPIVSKNNKKEQEEAGDDEQDPLASFLNEVSELEATEGTANAIEKVEAKKILVDHEKETAGWSKANQLDRLLQRNYKWLNLNPFYTFGMDINATEDDVSKRYKKLSTLVHPDKNRDPRAHDAFEEVQKAYRLLKVEESRTNLVKLIQKCHKRVKQTRTRLKKKGLSEKDLIARDGTLLEAMEKEVKKEFASRENKRLMSEQHQRTYNQRDVEKQKEERAYWKDVQETEINFREGREKRANNWQGFAKSGLKKRDRPKLKMEERRENESKKQKSGIDESYKANWR